MHHDHDNSHARHAHDGGLLQDLDTLAHQAADKAAQQSTNDRRQALRWLGMAGAAAVPMAVAMPAHAASKNWWQAYLAWVQARKTGTTTGTGTGTGTTTGTGTVTTTRTGTGMGTTTATSGTC